MKTDTLLALGIIATNVSLVIHTWQLRRHEKRIARSNHEFNNFIIHVFRQNRYHDETRETVNRLVQRVEQLDEFTSQHMEHYHRTPAPKVGRQWP